MMINMNDTSPQPEETKPDPFQVVANLLDLLVNVTASKARLVELRDTTAAAEKSSAKAAADMEAATMAKRRGELEIERQRAAHTAKLDQEREQHDREIARKHAEADERERHTKAALAQPQADAAKTAADRAEIERRLRALSGA
jgi:hypothetical protein